MTLREIENKLVAAFLSGKTASAAADKSVAAAALFKSGVKRAKPMLEVAKTLKFYGYDTVDLYERRVPGTSYMFGYCSAMSVTQRGDLPALTTVPPSLSAVLTEKLILNKGLSDGEDLLRKAAADIAAKDPGGACFIVVNNEMATPSYFVPQGPPTRTCVHVAVLYPAADHPDLQGSSTDTTILRGGRLGDGIVWEWVPKGKAGADGYLQLGMPRLTSLKITVKADEGAASSLVEAALSSSSKGAAIVSLAKRLGAKTGKGKDGARSGNFTARPAVDLMNALEKDVDAGKPPKGYDAMRKLQP